MAKGGKTRTPANNGNGATLGFEAKLWSDVDALSEQQVEAAKLDATTCLCVSARSQVTVDLKLFTLLPTLLLGSVPILKSSFRIKEVS